jgi:hypothetical protein
MIENKTSCVTDILFFNMTTHPFYGKNMTIVYSAPINSSHILTYSWYERRCKGIIWKPKEYTCLSHTWITNQQ